MRSSRFVSGMYMSACLRGGRGVETSNGVDGNVELLKVGGYSAWIGDISKQATWKQAAGAATWKEGRCRCEPFVHARVEAAVVTRKSRGKSGKNADAALGKGRRAPIHSAKSPPWTIDAVFTRFLRGPHLHSYDMVRPACATAATYCRCGWRGLTAQCTTSVNG